jgi:hypothetical protein
LNLSLLSGLEIKNNLRPKIKTDQIGTQGPQG